MNYSALIQNRKSVRAFTDKYVSFDDLDKIKASVEFIRNCGLSYEFRTTVVRELHTASDFRKIGEWLQGCEAYFLQSYQESDGVISPVFSSYTKKELENFLEILRPYIPSAALRGVE